MLLRMTVDPTLKRGASNSRASGATEWMLRRMRIPRKRGASKLMRLRRDLCPPVAVRARYEQRKSLPGKRIDPLQSRKSGEIPIRGVEYATIFHGERGELGICGRWAADLAFHEHAPKESPVTILGCE